MHFEFLIEDKSGKLMLDIIIPKILGDSNTFKIAAYGGLGRLPKGKTSGGALHHQALLNDLPRILRGYGKTHANYQNGYEACVVVVCDLDNKCLSSFKKELLEISRSCNPEPLTRFCIAIEEGEAWFLGDMNAIRSAYPKAKMDILRRYKNDSICGTWEKLEEIIGEGSKSDWAINIAPKMNIDCNKSPSFQYFVKQVKELAQ